MAKVSATVSPPRNLSERLATPAQWLVAAAFVQAAAWAAPPALNNDRALQDTYYVTVHAHYVLSLAATMVVFAALYLFLDNLVQAPRRRGLRLLHLGLVLGGDLLILSPPIVLRLTGIPRRYEDFGPMLAFWNWFGTAGYAMTLAGLVLFAVVVVDAIRNRLRGQAAS